MSWRKVATKSLVSLLLILRLLALPFVSAALFQEVKRNQKRLELV